MSITRLRATFSRGPRWFGLWLSLFELPPDRLAERLMDALDAAQRAGGDARGMQSGAILVVEPRVRGAFHDRVVDIESMIIQLL